MSDKHTYHLLDHIASLRIASWEQIGGGEADELLRMGLIREVWTGSYALTEKGQETRKEMPVAPEKRPRRPRKSKQTQGAPGNLQ